MARRFGTVRRLSTSRYQAIYTHPHDGRQVARSFDSSDDAEHWLLSERRRLAAGDWHDARGARLRLGEYFEQWITGKVLAVRTVELYQHLWRLHLEPVLGRRRLEELTPVVVRAWHSELVSSGRTGPTTIAKSYRLLSSITNDAARDGLMLRSPCTIRGAGSERAPEMRTITPTEIRLVADAMPDHLQALVLVAAYGGLRWGELAGLRLGAVDLRNGCVRVDRVLIETTGGALSYGPPKTAAGSRTVHLPTFVTTRLKEHIHAKNVRQPQEHVFSTVTGAPLRRTGFRLIWRDVTHQVGLSGLRFHDLRHTAATLATTHGATIREVQSRLGHSTPHAALRYQHALADRDRYLANILNGVEISGAVSATFGLRAVGSLSAQ